MSDQAAELVRYRKALRAIADLGDSAMRTGWESAAMDMRMLARAALAGGEGAGESAVPDLILIETRGDHSVGIQGECLTIRWPGAHALDNREGIREMLRRFWSQMLEEPAGVTFGDECPDCGQVGKHGYGCQEIPL